MKKLLALALTLVPMAATYAQSATDLLLGQSPNPLNSEAALSGSMLSNETELLTPRGIIDSPAQLTLTQELALPTASVSISTPGL